jgi:hypothetical protein
MLKPVPDDDNREELLAEQILDALRGLRFGSVEIVVHEARIVQIVRTEKVRMGTEIAPREAEARVRAVPKVGGAAR